MAGHGSAPAADKGDHPMRKVDRQPGALEAMARGMKPLRSKVMDQAYKKNSDGYR